MSSKPKISNSEMQVFLSCRRRWMLSYYMELGEKRAPTSTGPLQLGTRIHEALHAFYVDEKPMLEQLDEGYDRDLAGLESWQREEIVDLKKEQDLAHAMLEGFMDWRVEEGIDVGMQLVDAESVIEVEHPAIPGAILRGKLDQRWTRMSDGARLFRDWKTVQNFADADKLLPMDPQMLFYHLLEILDARAKTGSEPEWRTDGALYVMLRKVKRTATARPPFYAHREVHHNSRQIASMFRRVQTVVAEILKLRYELDKVRRDYNRDLPDELHQSLAPPRPSRDCSWMCPFFVMCPMMDDGSNWKGMTTEHFEHVDPHERYRIHDAAKGAMEK